MKKVNFLRGLLFLLLFVFSLPAYSACSIDAWAEQVGSVEAVPEANYYGDCGLRVDSDGQSAYVAGAAYVEDQTPGSVTPPVTEYAARFYVDATNITKVSDPAELVIFQGWKTDGAEAFHVKFAICDGNPVVSGHVFNANTDNITLPSGWQEITVFWKQDGTLRLRVAGVGEDTTQGDTTTLALDSVRLGIATGTLRLFTGVLHFDEFESTRGGDPGPKVNVCGQPLVALNDMVIDENFTKVCRADDLKIKDVVVSELANTIFESNTVSIDSEFSIENGATVSFISKF